VRASRGVCEDLPPWIICIRIAPSFWTCFPSRVNESAADSGNLSVIALVTTVMPDHRTLRMRMTSLLALPLVNASCVPSRDQSKWKICPD
jgi:hypothetical protein